MRSSLTTTWFWKVPMISDDTSSVQLVLLALVSHRVVQGPGPRNLQFPVPAHSVLLLRYLNPQNLDITNMRQWLTVQDGAGASGTIWRTQCETTKHTKRHGHSKMHWTSLNCTIQCSLHVSDSVILSSCLHHRGSSWGLPKSWSSMSDEMRTRVTRVATCCTRSRNALPKLARLCEAAVTSFQIREQRDGIWFGWWHDSDMMGCCCSRSWCMVAGVIHHLSNFSRCYVRNMPSSPESIPPQTSSILLSSSMPCGPACKDLKKVSPASGKQVWCGHLQITGHNRGASCHCKQFKAFRLIRVFSVRLFAGPNCLSMVFTSAITAYI